MSVKLSLCSLVVYSFLFYGWQGRVIGNSTGSLSVHCWFKSNPCYYFLIKNNLFSFSFVLLTCVYYNIIASMNLYKF